MSCLTLSPHLYLGFPGDLLVQKACYYLLICTTSYPRRLKAIHFFFFYFLKPAASGLGAKEVAIWRP